MDDIDLERRTGWSVLVVGMATVISNHGRIRELDRAGIDSWWASGPSAHYVAIEMGRVSGRHLVGGPVRSPDATAHD